MLKRVPEALLDRVRLIFAAFFSLVALLGLLDLTRMPRLAPIALTVFVAAHLVLAGWGVWVYATRGRYVLVDLIVPISLIAAGIAANDYELLFARLYGALLLAGLFGPPRRTAANAASFFAAYQVAVYSSHGVAGFTVAQLGSNIIGVIAITYVMHTLRNALEQQEATARQESVLTRASTDLLAAKDEDDVISAALTGVQRLVDPDGEGDVHVSLWRQHGDALELVGGRGAGLQVSRVPLADLPEPIVSAYLAGDVLEVDASQLRAADRQLGVEHDFTHGLSVPAVIEDTQLGGLFVGAQRPIDPTVVPFVQRFVHQVALADTLVRRNRLLAGVVDHSPDGILLVSGGRIEFASNAVGALSGVDVSDLTGRPLGSLLHRLSGDEFIPVSDVADAESHAERLRIGAGVSARDVEATFSAIGGGDVVVNLRDVTDRRRLERELAHVAFHDAVTGLPNRRLFQDRMSHAGERARRDESLLVVAVVDLDDFKGVNDSHGHDAGDQLLRVAAERLRSVVRRSDTVARIGGDEFALLLEDLDAVEDVEAVLRRALDELRKPVELEHATAARSGSMGVATSATSDDLLRDADVAMYVAKRRGKNQLVHFEPSMQSDMLEVAQLHGELQLALDEGQLVLEYQPIHDLGSGAVTGFEALVRWHHPDRGTMLPSSFIPVAESTGLIVPIGRWVLQEACRQLVAWREHGDEFGTIGVSVNVSARQLVVPGFDREVLEALELHGLAPDALTLEVTESVLMDDPEPASHMLGRLRRHGVKVAIDDFGTGYASFAYLQRFPVDVIKIDRAFVSRITRSAQEAAFAHAIARLAESLGISTTAEGVEHDAEVALLRSWGCTFAQGWLWAPSLPPNEAVGWLSRGSLDRGSLDVTT